MASSMETCVTTATSDNFSVESLKQEASILEEAELSLDISLSLAGLDPNAYSRLYAIYLIIGEMTAAKFLWKRIPVSVKSGDEMKQLWKIGCKLWTGDLKTVYELIQAFNWSPVIENYIRTLEQTVRQNSINLIQKAYGVIKLDVFCELTGCRSEQSAKELLSQLGWDLNSKFVTPKGTQNDRVLSIEFEDELSKLTRIISAIEN
ncbi:COP9 signalosome complex subunit 8-like isoform X1 [Convolutriloba macropyga]|uniref:COP9 signalosome complex subunit 8-like isoform X1 n=1 Tax=Convolutriloba macropyga TaxID=536237 RepID=UPI003F52624B